MRSRKFFWWSCVFIPKNPIQPPWWCSGARGKDGCLSLSQPSVLGYSRPEQQRNRRIHISPAQSCLGAFSESRQYLSQQNEMRAANNEMNLVLTLSRFISEPLFFMFQCHRSFFKAEISRFLATSRITSWGWINEMDWISCRVFFQPQV